MKKSFTILILILLLGWTRVLALNPYTVSVTTALSSFGNVATNTTAGPNSFTVTITSVSSVIVPVAALNGFTYCATSGGTYTTTLSLSASGGFDIKNVFVKFTPTAVQSYNGNIVVGGTTNVAASGSGISATPPVQVSATLGIDSGGYTTLKCRQKK
ncbi:MAG: hypothetical protein ACOYO1_20165 [Bacteroidales bacterium]